MKTTPHNTTPLTHHRSCAGASLVATCMVILLGTVSGLADNPWSSSMGWSSSLGTSAGWSSWDSTHGGTFGGSSPSSHEPSHASHASHRSSHSAPPPVAVHDATIDPVMIEAGSIAEHRALSHSNLLCWRYVKEALVAAGGVSSYPQTTYAKQAGDELVRNYGFVRLPVSCAERAPVGSVIVYGGAGAGHVELRTATGFVSDYRCRRASGLPFIGAYARVHHTQTAQIASNVTPGS